MSAVWVVPGWGVGAVVAAATAAVVVGAGRVSVGPADNRRGWMQRYIQLNHN